jgi:lipid A 3-O-deacylase
MEEGDGTMKRVFRLGVALALGLASGPSRAQTFGVWIDNDIAGGTDRYYTNGIQLHYVTPARPLYGAFDTWADAVPGAAAAPERRWGFAVGQKLFTPEDIQTDPPSSKDRPYAGWLYARASVLSATATQADRLELDLGVVGPWALGKETHRFAHRVLPGQIRPEGWDNQLRNEPGVMVSFERVWRNPRPKWAGGLDADFSPHIAAAVGNVLTYAGVGASVRLGWNLPPMTGALVVRPVSPIPYQDAEGEGFTAFLFLSGEARAVARNIFLDGNTFRDGPSVDKIPGVATVQAGLAVGTGAVRLIAAYNVTTPEFETQKGAARFGSLRMAFRF